VIGSDHGVTIPVVDALDAVGELVHILHVDAHLNWREDVGGVRRGYSSSLHWASKVKAVSGMTQVGLRAIGSARRLEVEAARTFRSELFSAERIHAGAWTRCCRRFRKDGRCTSRSTLTASIRPKCRP
jgi:agmatinase